MGPVYLFDLAARHAQWAAARQATISGNIANANTPGFQARDVAAFSEILDKTHLVMAKTSSAHIAPAGDGPGTARLSPSDSWDVSHSGNTVSLEQEMLKAGEVNRAYSLNTSIVRSFHRMVLAGVRSGA